MRVRGVIILLSVILVSLGLFLFLNESNDFILVAGEDQGIIKEVKSVEPVIPKITDIEPQPHLANPPDVVKAIYLTSWSAGSEKKLKYLIDLANETEINAVVIDIKDYSGYLSYNTDLELPRKYDAVELRIPQLNKLVKRLHEAGIYVIGRISVFQDQRLALARPDLALFSSTTKEVWRDHKGLTWMDTASQEVWDYNIAVAKEILSRGVDEANFDYVRFASDGALDDIGHPFWDEKTLKTKIVRNFFERIREELPEGKISADLFGLVTVNKDGLGIGQHLEYAIPIFDAVAPMVYPSHYFKGFIGYDNPAEYPYEVIKYSMDAGLQRIADFKIHASTTPVQAKFRPWFQDFDLGADYDAVKVRAQIQAWEDSVAKYPELNGGWMLWNPANIYTKAALQTEQQLTQVNEEANN